jgi:NAD(P)-dependent dehydrogenase (short-subunit alcohol dehydrogenase family)
MNRLDGKVVVITGGASGIGKACAVRCAHEGAKVAVCDIQDNMGKEVAANINNEGLSAKYYHIDVSKENEVEKMFRNIVSELGLIEGLVNAAGIADPKNDNVPIHEGKLETWERILRVNLIGVLLCTKHALPYMIRAGKGSIVNVSSLTALIALPGVAYTASKGAVLAITRLCAVEYAKYNIRVNSIAPGFVDTPLLQSIWKEDISKAKELERSIPINRLGKPEEVASVITFLLSDDASYITGTNTIIDGGFTSK